MRERNGIMDEDLVKLYAGLCSDHEHSMFFAYLYWDIKGVLDGTRSL